MADPMNDKRLHQLMQPRIDDSSLYILCEYIKADVPTATDLDSNGLPGDTLSVKSMSLIRYCRQRQILHTLIENLHLVRPDMLGDNYAIWLAWATAQDNPQATSSATLSASAPAPTVNPSTTIPAKRRLRDELIEELYPELEAATNSKDWDTAISLGQNILALNPSHQPTKDKLKLAYHNRGDDYREQRKYEQALADYNQTIRLDPNFANAYYNRGDTYYSQHQYEQALADYNQAIRLDPAYAWAYRNRGFVYYGHGQYEQALTDYNQAIRLDPNDAIAHGIRGNFYYDQGQYEQALADYNQAIHLDPNLAILYNNRGDAYRSKGDKARAIADYVYASELGDEAERRRAERALKELGVG